MIFIGLASRGRSTARHAAASGSAREIAPSATASPMRMSVGPEMSAAVGDRRELAKPAGEMRGARAAWRSRSRRPASRRQGPPRSAARQRLRPRCGPYRRRPSRRRAPARPSPGSMSPSASWPVAKTRLDAVPRSVSGISASAAAAKAAVTPGTTSNGTFAARSAAISSPARPKTSGSPDFSRTTRRPAEPRGRGAR